MLYEFLTESRADLIARAEAKVARRPLSKSGKAEHSVSGVPVFLSQLAAILKEEASGGPVVSGSALATSASRHGHELLRSGFTIDQVVHSYGDVCQSVTELALDRHYEISTEEFHTLNRALDDAIASAVTEYGRQREEDIAAGETARLGLAFEQRSLICSGLLAWELLKKGTVGVGGNTGAVLTRCFAGLREINNRSNSGPPIPAPSLTDG